MKFEGVHIFDYDATFRGDVTIEGNLTISNSVSQTISFGDNDSLYFGDGNDLQIYYDGTDSRIYNNTGDFVFRNNQNDGDIKFQCDDGSGGITTYFSLDGGASQTIFSKHAQFVDGQGLLLGSGIADLQIIHNGTDSFISNDSGDLIIQQKVDDKDIIFKCDDGSGGIETYFFLDGSQGLVNFPDDKKLAFGTGNDLRIFHEAGSTSKIENYTGNLTIQQRADDADIVFQCDDGSGGITEYFRLDGGDADGTLTYTKWADNSIVTLGAGKDLRIYHNGTNSIIQNYTGDLKIRNGANDSDIIFDCDDGSGGLETYFFLDGSASAGAPFTVFPDSSNLTIGTGFDLRLKHDGSHSYIQQTGTGDLYIQNTVNDKDIIFQSDDGSGGNATYLQLDGSTVKVLVNKSTIFYDTIEMASYIYHNGDTNTYFGFSGADTYTLVTGGTTALTVNSSQAATFAGDVTVSGNLTVSGTTTTIDTTNLNVEDKNITLNYSSGDSSSTADGAGITIQDAVDSSTDATILWDATNDEFDFSHGATFAGPIEITSSSVTDFVKLVSGGSSANPVKLIFEKGASEQGIIEYNRNGDLEIYNTDGDGGVMISGSASADPDFYISHAGASTFKSTLTVGEDDTGHDVIFYGATSGRYLQWDESQDRLEYKDGVEAVFGNDNDLRIYHSTQNYIIGNGGDIIVEQKADDKDIIFKSDDGSGGTTTYFFLDGSQTRTQFDKDIMLIGGANYIFVDNSAATMTFADGALARFGTSGDLRISHDSNHSYISQEGTGSLFIRNTTDDKDIIFQSDDGSGGLATYFQLDGSHTETVFSEDIRFADNKSAKFGASNDLTIHHNGSNSYITQQGTGDLYLMNTTDDKDIIFLSDDGSGGVTTYLRIDGSATTVNVAKQFIVDTGSENLIAEFKSSGDSIGEIRIADSAKYTRLLTVGDTFKIMPSDGDEVFNISDSAISVLTPLTVGVDDTGHDVKFFGATSGKYLLWDESDNALEFTDSTYLYLGNSADLKLYHDGSSSYIENNTGNLNIMSRADDADLVFWCDDGSGGDAEYFRLDGGDGATRFSRQLVMQDNVNFAAGSGVDLRIYHDATNSYIHNDTGDLRIENDTTDGDIIFRSDNGSGGLSTYFRVDGGLQKTIFPDNQILAFGSVGDLNILHDGTDSYVSNDTGHLYIRNQANDKNIVFVADDGSGGNQLFFQLYGNHSGNPVTQFPDNSQLHFGTGFDFRITHDGSQSILNNQTGNLEIAQNADDADIIFKCDDGSGGTTAYITLDGGLGYTTAQKQIRFADSVEAAFGGIADLTIAHDATNSTIANNTGDLYIKNRADDKDIIFECDDQSGGVTTYFRVDGSTGYVKFEDNRRIAVGSGEDTHIYHDGSNSYITHQGTGHLKIRQTTNDSDIIFECDDGSGGLTTYFKLDGSLATHDGSATTALSTLWPDNSKIVVGDGADGRFWHNGTNTFIQNTTGDLEIQNYSDDKDIIFKNDDGSGGVTEYFRLDGGNVNVVASKNFQFLDDVKVKLGSSTDMELFHNGSNSFIDNYTGDMYIRQNADDKDLIFQCDDGSGGGETYFFLDGSNGLTTFPDDKVLGFGNASDLRIKHDGSNSYIIQQGTGDLIIQNTADDEAIIFQCDDGSGGVETYFQLEGASGGGDPFTVFPDSSTLVFGSGHDYRFRHDGTHSYIQNYVGNLNIYNYTDDGDINFYCDDGSGGTTVYLTIDGSATNMKVHKDMRFNDNVDAEFGTGGDFKIYHDGSNTYLDQINSGVGNIVIQNQNDDADITFKTDDGSGSITEYFRLDGSSTQTIFSKNQQHADNVTTFYGNSGDLSIYHDGSNSYIKQVSGATGDLIITQNVADKDIILKSDDGSGGETAYITLDGSIATTTMHRKVNFNDNGIFANNTELRWKDSGGTERTILELTSADDLYFGGSFSGSMIFVGGGSYTERMRIDDSGNLQFPDNALIKIGAEGDLQLTHDASNSHLINYTGDLKITNNANDKDVLFLCDDQSGGNAIYFYLDGSVGFNRFPYPVIVEDSVNFNLGTGQDMQLLHNGSDSVIRNATGDLYIQQNADDKDIVFQCDDGSGGGTTYIQLDGSATTTVFYKDSRFNDSIDLNFGNANDLILRHDGSNSYMLNGTGDLYIRNNTDDKDIIFQSDDGSGGVETYFFLDGSTSSTVFPDSKYLYFGSGHDMRLYFDGTDGYVQSIAGDMIIRQSADDKDILFQCDDGSGGLETYFYLDGSNNFSQSLKHIRFADNASVLVGSSSDLSISHNGTTSVIANNGGNLQINQNVNDGDIILQCDDGSGGTTAYITLDGSAGYTTVQKQIRLEDSVEFRLGDSGDSYAVHNGSNFFLVNDTGDLTIKNSANDKDIIFQCDDGSGGTETYFYLDGSHSSGNPYTHFPDNSHLVFGASTDDLDLYHNGTNSYIQNTTGNLIINQRTNDGDLILQCDDGSGGETAYITLDGSEAEIHVHKTIGIGTTNPDTNYKIDIAGKAQVQSVLELDDVLTLNAISTPADPATNKSSIYMDAADGSIKVKINVGGTTVTRTLASFE